MNNPKSDMNKLLKSLVLALAITTGIASASLQPGEVSLKGKVLSFNKKDKSITYLVHKTKQELTFKYENGKKPFCKFDGEKISTTRYTSKQKDMIDERLIIFQDIKKWTKDNPNYEGFVARKLYTISQEYWEEHYKREPSKR